MFRQAIFLVMATWATFCCTHGSIQCYDANDCYQSALATTEKIECFGKSSCEEASLSSSNSEGIQCEGAFACYKATSIETTSDSRSDIQCDGLFSCAAASKLHTVTGSISCGGEKSCFNVSHIYIEETDTSSANDLYCHGDRSCAESRVTTHGNTYLWSSLSMMNSQFYNNDTDDDVEYQFYGSYSGYNGTIYCGGDATCHIYCDGNACNGLKLELIGDDSDFDIDCLNNGVEKSDICPNGYEIPSYIDIDAMPSLVDVKMSDYDNSIYPCDTSVNTNGIICDDKSECVSQDLDTTSTIGPICCTAKESCESSLNITAKIDNKTNYNQENVSIRCDGAESCDNVQSKLIFSKASVTSSSGGSSGNVYLTGQHAAGLTISNMRIQTSLEDLHDIFCTGTYSCRYTYLFNARNLYCTAAYSCLDVVEIAQIENVYLYGYQAGLAAVLHDVKNIYCSGRQACWSTTMMNITGGIYVSGRQSLAQSTIVNVSNLILLGYQAFYQSQVTNVSNVVCISLESCLDADILGLSGSLRANGRGSLNYANIVTNGDVVDVWINGTNSQSFTMTCSVNNTCTVRCLSAQACTRLDITNYGTLYLRCGLKINGADCPDVSGNLNRVYYINDTLIPTSEPTNGPTNDNTEELTSTMATSESSPSRTATTIATVTATATATATQTPFETHNGTKNPRVVTDDGGGANSHAIWIVIVVVLIAACLFGILVFYLRKMYVKHNTNDNNHGSNMKLNVKADNIGKIVRTLSPSVDNDDIDGFDRLSDNNKKRNKQNNNKNKNKNKNVNPFGTVGVPTLTTVGTSSQVGQLGKETFAIALEKKEGEGDSDRNENDQVDGEENYLNPNPNPNNNNNYDAVYGMHRTSEGGDKDVQVNVGELNEYDGDINVTGAPKNELQGNKPKNSDDNDFWTIGVDNGNDDQDVVMVNDNNNNNNNNNDNNDNNDQIDEINKIHDYVDENAAMKKDNGNKLDNAAHLAIEDAVMDDIIQHIDTQKE